MLRLSPCLLALLLVPTTGRAGDGSSKPDELGEILIDRTKDAVIVRSGTDAANFLFRAPPEFQKTAELKEPFQVDLQHGKARIRLSIRIVAAADLRKPAAQHAKGRETAYMEGQKGSPTITPDGPRARVVVGNRTILLVRDGRFLYELWLDGEAVKGIADTFTILSPKGAPIASGATPEQLKAKTLEHDYYRLKVLKPQGFRREPVDPDADRGIWIYLRAEDDEGSVCQIRMRVHLARTTKKSLSDMAQGAINRFAKKYPKGRVPKAPKRTRWKASKEAYRIKCSGRLAKSGLVIQEERVFLHHENGRIYEIQVTNFAGGARSFSKQIKAFWKSIRIANR